MNTKLNKSDWLLIAAIYSVTTIINAIQYYNQGNRLIEYLIDFPLAIILSVSVILIFIHWLIPEFMIKKKNYPLLIFFGCLILSITGMIDYTVGYWTAGSNWDKFPNTINLILKSFFRIAEDVGFTFGILLTKKFYESQSNLLKVQKQQKENELKLLRSQIDPHFLFNNLNTLDSLIDSDSEKAKEYINRLSLIYRYLIQTKDAEVMELSKEIQFAENYIFLIETRFGSDYKFNIKREGEISDKFIPTGALQALLENVVKHNKANNKPIQTEINITNNWITVNNTKSNNPNKESLGTGLQNLQTRYELLSDKKVDIKNVNSRFIISIPIIKLSEES